jgi:cell division protein FtsW (lipid II flippase)
VADLRLASSKTESLLLVLALAFGWIGATSLALQNAGGSPLAAIGLLSLLTIIAHLWLNRVAPGRDSLLLPIMVILTAFGLLSVARVAPNFQNRQLASLCVAMVAFLAITASHDRLRWLRRFKYTWLIAAFALLLTTLFFGVNPAGPGARLWLSVAGLFVQPSEILRLLVIAFLAAYFSERLGIGELRLGVHAHSSLSTLQSLAPTIAMWLVAFALLMTQQDLGAASLLLITYVFMLYVATGQARLPLILLAALVVAGGAGYFASDRVAQRLNIWLNPWADPQGSSFQVVQSLIAIASGGIFGQGLNQGSPDYVPAVHTDFPFVMVGEEMGLFGALALIVCFAVLSLRGWRVALTARTGYRMLLAGGLSAMLAIQVFVIIGGNLSLLPLTGVTLPLVSYGGTSLLVTYISIALLIRLSADVQLETTTVQPAAPQQSLRAARKAARLCATMFLVLGLAIGFLGVARAQVLVARGDNPRRVDAELAIRRGPILTANADVLAYSTCEGADAPLVPCAPASANNGQRVRYVRGYPIVAAAPVIGYYSQRYGAGGVEGFADATLRGRRTTLDEWLHQPQIGAPVTVTLNLDLQRALFNALNNASAHTTTRGAGLVMNWRTGEVLALTSAPSFDPNTLDDDWDELRNDPLAPLVNRATQGLYQPGLLLRWFLQMKDQGSTTKDDRSSFIAELSSLDLDKSVPFELPNEAVPLPSSAVYSETTGQGSLRMTPLRVATTVASLAAGRPITPTLLARRNGGSEFGDSYPPSPTPNRESPFIAFAQIGRNQFVGWYVSVDDERVTVIAIEQSTPNQTALRQVAESLPPGRQ